MKSKIILTAAALAIIIPFGVANAKDDDEGQATRSVTGKDQKVSEVETGELARAETEAVRERIEQAKETAKAKAEQAKEAAKARQLALKQDRCEANKAKLTERLPQLSQNVTTIKKVLDTKYAKVTAIYESGKLDTTNYAKLDDAIKEKQAAAAMAISELDPAATTIDCNDNGLGVVLDSYRAGLSEVKAALKEYHTALVDMVSALNAAADKAEAEGSKPEDDDAMTNSAANTATNTTANTATNSITEGAN